MNSLYLDYDNIPQGDLQCLEHCTTVEGSKYFSYDPRNSVSMVEHLLAKSLLIQCLTCSIVSAIPTVRS